MAGLLRGFRRTLANDRNLRRFVVEATPTGKQLGTGSYGSVEEVEVNGLTCAAKKIHEILLDVGNVGVQRIASMFVQECQLMSDLRHPNVTLFIGICFVPDCQLPLLVMERLEGSIDDLLESVPDVPLALKRSMLEDVARGLLYLHNHNPQIVHRDLTAKNVLLTSLLVAKVTDLGNSRIVNLQPGQLAQTLSQNPGTLVYMPPEALTDTAHYGPSLDVFSFGHLFLFVGTQVFPGKLLEPTYADPENRRRLLGRSEYERRGTYVDQLKNKLPTGERHPFLQLISRCLQNDPSDRPTAEHLVAALVEMKVEVDGPYGEFAKLDALKQVATLKALRSKDSAVREKSAELAVKEMEIQQLHQELEQIKVEKVDAEAQYQRDIQQRDSELQEKEAELQRCNLQLQQKKNAEVQYQSDLQQANSELQQKEMELQRCREQKEIELQQKNEQLKQMEVQLKQKDNEISSLRLREERKWEDRQRDLCKFRLYCHHPSNNELIEKRLEIHKDKTLKETIVEAHKLMELEGEVLVEQCRLVRYDDYTETLDQSFDEHLDLLTFGDHVGGARTYYSFELFLEIRGEGEEFHPYNKGGLNLKVLVIDLPEASVREPILLRAEQTWKVQDLKTTIAKLGLNEKTMKLTLETYNNDRKYLGDPNVLLKTEGFYRRHTVYVCCDPEDYERDFDSSDMHKIIDKYVNRILLYITIPAPPKCKWKQGYKPHQRTIYLHIDRRSTLADLKRRLEEYVLIPSSEFKIYRIPSNNQEYLMSCVQDTLQSVPNEAKMIVRPGRALRPGEFRPKLFLLEINKPEFFKPLLDSIIAKGMTVREFKEQVMRELYEQGVDIPLNVSAPYLLSTIVDKNSLAQTLCSRIRLRKKTWQSPCAIFLDSQVFDKDIHLFANFDMYIECLNGPDQMMVPTQTQVYVRHWHPSTYTVDNTEEIILSDNSPEHLKLKLSELSGIPVERVEFARAYGSFPCEMSVLDIESKLIWNPTVTTISSMPLAIYDDGSILYFKDSKEQLMRLGPAKRKKLAEKEEARLRQYRTKIK